MNLSYFRKSTFTKEESISKLKEGAKSASLELLGEIDLPEVNGVLLNLCNKKWLSSIMQHDKNLVGLLPCSIAVLQKDGITYVGAGNPTVLSGVTDSTEVQKLAAEAETVLRRIINEATGTKDLKPSKIKLYSTTTCPYCTMEKQWLEANKVEHEVIYVDKDQAEAEKMVKNTGQMGVPVTEIQYEEGESEYIIGFNKAALSKVIGL